jgi:coatomer protein complex subunit gamma
MAVKHIFKEHIIIQYNIKNMLPNTILKEVLVVMFPSNKEDTIEEDFIIPVYSLATDIPRTIYITFKKSGGKSAFLITSFTNALKFTSKEINLSTSESDNNRYKDKY